MTACAHPFSLGCSRRWRCAPVWQVVHVPAVNKEEDLAEISRRANVPVSFQPAFTNRVPEDTAMLSGFAQTGARVYAQVSPRNFDLAIRLKHQSMILFGMPSWMKVDACITTPCVSA